MMEAASSFQLSSLGFYRTARRSAPEHSRSSPSKQLSATRNAEQETGGNEADVRGCVVRLGGWGWGVELAPHRVL